MYLLSFKEGENEPKLFYYHSYQKAEHMRRVMLTKEINNLIKQETGKEDIFDLDMNMSGNELQDMLDTLLRMTYQDDFDSFEIIVKVEEIFFEDDPIELQV